MAEGAKTTFGLGLFEGFVLLHLLSSNSRPPDLFIPNMELPATIHSRAQYTWIGGQATGQAGRRLPKLCIYDHLLCVCVLPILRRHGHDIPVRSAYDDVNAAYSALFFLVGRRSMRIRNRPEVDGNLTIPSCRLWQEFVGLFRRTIKLLITVHQSSQVKPNHRRRRIGPSPS
jgi:hypothetical protein